MSARTLSVTDRIYGYLLAHGVRESDVLRRLREETARMPRGRMQISPEEGQFLSMLVQILGARRTLEVGVFTGYSSLWIAQALPRDGEHVALDINAEWTAMAARYWEAAGVADRITLRLGPALETMDALLSDGQANTFDLAFIDADKLNYDGYYERALRLVRPGGLIAVDNVLWGGSVADPADQDEDTQTIRVLNAKIHQDPRVDMVMVPLGDGLTLARKRSETRV